MLVTGLTVVFDGAYAVTKSDTVSDTNGPFAALYVTTSGNLSFEDSLGNSPVGGAAFAVTAGQYIYVRCNRVNATNTTATVLGLKGGIF